MFGRYTSTKVVHDHDFEVCAWQDTSHLFLSIYIDSSSPLSPLHVLLGFDKYFYDDDEPLYV